MNTLKSVGNKLFKTELANHKVDLALTDDFYKNIQQGIREYVKADNKLKEYIKESKNVLDSFNLAGENLLLASKTYDELEKKIKELGLSMPSEISKNNSELNGYFKKIDASIKFLNSIK